MDTNIFNFFIYEYLKENFFGGEKRKILRVEHSINMYYHFRVKGYTGNDIKQNNINKNCRHRM